MTNEGDDMATFLSFRTPAFSILLFAALTEAVAFAAPSKSLVVFTPPLATAKTIQVTETTWEAQNGPTPGPLHLAGATTYRIERPNKFRVEWKATDPAAPAQQTVSDGTTLVSKNGGQIRTQPTARAEWPFPMMGLLNNSPGPVSAMPTIRKGRRILLAVKLQGPSRSEYWFDPKTHLLIEDAMFLTFQGKTMEVMRTEYTGWILNKPLPPAVFHMTTGKKDKTN